MLANNGNTVALIVLSPEHSPFPVITSKFRRFDVISTLLIPHVLGGSPYTRLLVCQLIACPLMSPDQQ